MTWQGWLLTVTILVAWWAIALLLNRRGVRLHENTGDVAQGIVVFAEPLRSFFVIWGFSQFVSGLRRGGCGGQVLLFRWTSWLGCLLAIPDMVSQKRLIAQGGRLARQIEQLADAHPGVPIHLAGYSTGCYVALEACRALDERVRLKRVVLLAGTISPFYALNWLAGRLETLHNVYSRLDVINWLAPVVFGTNDRRWGPACGTVGFDTTLPFVRQHAWRVADVKHGYCGDHFTVVSPLFIAEHVAPLLKDAPDG